MPELLVKRPPVALVVVLRHVEVVVAGHAGRALLGAVEHDRVDLLGFEIPLIARRHFLPADAALRQVDVALLVVHAERVDDLLPAHADELADGPNAPPGQLGQQDHALLGCARGRAD